MSKSLPKSVTVEEAVALMVNMDYIPTGFTLLDMTGAFKEEAEVEYENAVIDHFPEDRLEPLTVRMEACRARHSLAQMLTENLLHEVKNIDESMVILAGDSTSQARLTLASVLHWASDRFGIDIPTYQAAAPQTSKETVPDFCWEDVTIKIYANNKIGVSCKNGQYKRYAFNELGLMNKGKGAPNHQGDRLVDLSEGEKYTGGKTPSAKEKTSVSKLRTVLKKLTGLSADPFLPFNEYDGWKPRFKLIDDRRNADERAKKKAKSVSLEDCHAPTTPNFEREDDAAQKWIDKNE